MDRREFLKWMGLAGVGLLIPSWAAACEPRKNSLPSDQEILAGIDKLKFGPGTELWTTIFPRKITYEGAKYLESVGKWNGGDESDWRGHPEIINAAIETLAQNGFKGGRLELVPFEVTQDGENYDWTPVHTMVDLMIQHQMKVELSVGPLQFPYDPGIRVPKKFQEVLTQEIANGTDPSNLPINIDLRNYTLNYLEIILKEFGGKVDSINLGNEWPDTNNVEGINGGRMKVPLDLMQEWLKMAVKLTNKNIVLNTNIHPSNLNQLQRTFDPLFEILGSQGVLGIDAYPVRETSQQAIQYGDNIRKVKQKYPKLEMTEFGAELYATGQVAGKAWVDIEKNFRPIQDQFFRRDFPNSLQNYLVNSEIKKIGMWGAPAWMVMANMGDDLPLREMKALAAAMKRTG